MNETSASRRARWRATNRRHRGLAGQVSFAGMAALDVIAPHLCSSHRLSGCLTIRILHTKQIGLN